MQRHLNFICQHFCTLPMEIHFLCAPIDTPFNFIFFVFNSCVLPWRSPLHLKQCRLPTRCFSESRPALFSFGWGGKICPSPGYRYIPCGYNIHSAFWITLFERMKSLFPGFYRCFPGNEARGACNWCWNTDFLWSWEISRFHNKSVIMERNLTFLSFLHSADHTRSQFKSK